MLKLSIIYMSKVTYLKGNMGPYLHHIDPPHLLHNHSWLNYNYSEFPSYSHQPYFLPLQMWDVLYRYPNLCHCFSCTELSCTTLHPYHQPLPTLLLLHFKNLILEFSQRHHSLY